MTPEDAAAFERCISRGGVAVFPTDTVYGLGCEPDSRAAVERLYHLKGRRPDKPVAVMFFDLELALVGLPELSEPARDALSRLLPGAITVLLPNPARRFPPACVGDPETLGVRVPRLRGPLAPLAAVRSPVLQSSANLAGGPDPRRLGEVPDDIRAGADLVLDGGELPGRASTVVDLRGYDEDGRWAIVREGAADADEVARALG